MPEKWKTPPPGEFWSSSELSSALPALSLAGSQRNEDLFANVERDEWPGTAWSRKSSLADSFSPDRINAGGGGA